MKLVLLIAFVLICGFVEVHTADLRNGSQRSEAGHERYPKLVVRYLRAALKHTGGAARIDYATDCSNAENLDLIPFPRVEVRPAPVQKRGVLAVREVFRNDKNVTAIQDRQEMIRVRIGKPPSEILKTRIRLLKFDPSQQYNPLLALDVMEDAKEVQLAMTKLGLTFPETVENMGINEPTKGLPHLPPSLANITIGEVLDLVARTFEGIGIYGVCTGPGKNHLRFDFIGVVGAPELP